MNEGMVAPPPVEHQNRPPGAKNNRLRKILLACGVFLAIALIALLIWFFFFRNRVSTDDAYVDGNRVILNSQVEGSCIAYYADDNQYVEKGDLLVEIDPTNYELAFKKALEELENITRQVKNLQEQVIALEFDLLRQKRVVANAQYDFDNRQALVDVLAVSREDVEHNRVTLEIETDKLASIKAQLKGQMALLGAGPLEEHPWILAQQEEVRRCYADLTRCKIYAPVSGLVALRYIQVGQYVTPRTELMSVVPYEQMWVDANYKEGQLRNLRIGQPAKLTIDQFGSSVQFDGVVQGIQMGTGAAFSLLPAQNATGNWIKIVQRVPVRILLKPEQIRQHPLRIGLSAYVTVDTKDLSGPVLQQRGEFSWSQETNVTKIDFLPVDLTMNEIIQENLHGW